MYIKNLAILATAILVAGCAVGAKGTAPKLRSFSHLSSVPAVQIETPSLLSVGEINAVYKLGLEPSEDLTVNLVRVPSQKSGGFRLEIKKADQIVEICLRSPPPNAAVATVVTNPAALVIQEAKHARPVIFVGNCEKTQRN